MIYGKSGSGKTTLARHFIEEIRNETIIWWISCSGIKLNMRLQNLAEKLRITIANVTIEDLVVSIKRQINIFFLSLQKSDVHQENGFS